MVRDDGQAAADTLKEIEELRRQTRRRIHPASFPMTLFGVLGLVQAPLCAVGHGLALAVFWVVAAPAGGVLTSRHYRSRARATGAGVWGRPYWVIAAGIFVAAFLTGASGSPRVHSAGPMLAVAVGYLAFARLERSPLIAAVSVALGVAAIVVGAAGLGHACVVLSLTFGASFTAAGLVLRHQERG